MSGLLFLECDIKAPSRKIDQVANYITQIVIFIARAVCVQSALCFVIKFISFNKLTTKIEILTKTRTFNVLC